jgi:hypothetical protein
MMNTIKLSFVIMSGIVLSLLGACASSGAKMPILEYGADKWTIAAVEACKRIQTSPNNDPNGIAIGGGDSAIIRITFKCETNTPITKIIANLSERSLRDVYFTDENNKKYEAYAGGGSGLSSCKTNFLAFNASPEKAKNLTLYFFDATPVPLPEPALTEDCKY